MRTKHLFSAAMLTALFAACSNEELGNLTAPEVNNDGRLTVQNVKLDFSKGNDATGNTRVVFDPATGDYSWVNGDKVGALLMDQIDGTDCKYRPYSDSEEWAKLTWTEKYDLINYIHTDYPFVYNKADGTWTSNAAMLEGNYFFVSPYEGYNSKRQLIHSIAGQTQKDGTIAATAEAFGKNQYWIGYSQIKEGNKTSEALTNVEMTRVLAPIRFEIKMIGTQTYKVNKITIQGEDVRTLLTIDPTCDFDLPSTDPSEGYKGENGEGAYNLEDGSGTDIKHFNYANYLSNWDPAMKDEVYDHTQPIKAANNRVFNIDDSNNYNRFNALRAIVDVESVKTDEVQYAEMSYETEQTLSKSAEVINGVIFVNPDLVVAQNKLTMSIYTDKGVIKDINLTVVNTEIEKSNGRTTVITDKAITKLTPTTQNLIKIQVDDNSIDAADVLTVNNENDLKQFIDWNKDKNRPYLAVLANDATLTKDMVEILRAAKKANADNKLIVTTNNDRKLIIAADAAADAFEFVCLDGETFDTNHNSSPDDIKSVDVEVLGTLDLNSETAIALPDGSTRNQITVAKDATLNIIGANTTKLLIVENNGTITMAKGAEAKNIEVVNNEKATMDIAGSMQFEVNSVNYGSINVAVTGVLQGTTEGNITNNGLIKNNGIIWNIVNEDVETAIVETSELTNHFKSNGTNATIKLTRLTDDVTGLSTNDGHILYVGANVDLSDATEAGVTDLIVSGYLRSENDITAATVKTITVEEGESITIEGGSYSLSVWTAGAQKLNVTTGAVLNLSGNVTMNHLTDDIKADVKILKGSLSINKGTVAAINDLTLGSKEAFTEFGATVNVAKGATLTIAGAIECDPDVSNTKPVINNNGIVTAATFTDIPSKIVVNGNTVETTP